MNENFIESVCGKFLQSQCKNRTKYLPVPVVDTRRGVAFAAGSQFNHTGYVQTQADVDMMAAAAEILIKTVAAGYLRIFETFPSDGNYYDVPYGAFIGDVGNGMVSVFDTTHVNYSFWLSNAAPKEIPILGPDTTFMFSGWVTWFSSFQSPFFLLTQVISLEPLTIRRNWMCSTGDNVLINHCAAGIGGNSPYYFNVGEHDLPTRPEYSDVNDGISPGYGPFRYVADWPINKKWKTIPLPPYADILPACGLMNYLSIDLTPADLGGGAGGAGSAGGSGSAGGGFDEGNGDL